MFAHSSIKSIIIPTNIIVIEIKAFYECTNLKEIRVAKDSKLRLIQANAFDGSSIETIDIPANFDVFENGWSYNTPYLSNINISKDNKKYKELNGLVLLNSTNSDKDCDEKYDTIVFTKRNIKNVIVPKYVKFVGSYSFEKCTIDDISFEPSLELKDIVI